MSIYMKNKAIPEPSRQRGVSLLEILIVMGIMLVVAGIAIPKVLTIVQNLRTSGDARDLNGTILMAKMRASSNYAQARVHANLTANTFYVEVKPSGAAGWTTEGGTQNLSTNVTFGYGSTASPPASTQTTIGQAPLCDGTANTACITFNSRGIPVDSTNTPTGNDALYVTDGKSASAVTVSVTGLTQIWRGDLSSTGNWIKR